MIEQPASPPAPVGRASWGLPDVAIMIALTLLVSVVAVMVVPVLLPDTPTGRAWESVLLVVLPWLGLGGWPLYATSRSGGHPIEELRLRLGGWRHAVVGVGAGLVALVLAYLVAVLTEAVVGHPLSSAVGDLAEQTTSASRGALVALALTAAVGAPIVEETAFRGLFYGAMVKRGVPVLSSVLLSAVLFALFHFEPLRFPLLLVIGLVLGAVRARTDSTAASILTHMTVNVIGAVQLLSLHS